MKKRYPAQRVFHLIAAAVAVTLGPMFTSPAVAADNIVSSAETAASTLYTLTGTDSLTITNTGEINATAGADAIYVDGSATGVTIDNSGMISAAGGGYAITLDALSLGTSITNQAGAIISASTTAINYDGSLDGSLTNAGTIEISNTSSGTAIYVNGDVSGTLTNSGTIRFLDPSSGEFNGIYVGGDVSGTITNSGLISIEGTRGYSDTYYGINIQGSLTGTLVNSGVIRLTGMATDDVYLEGIYVGDIGATGNLLNSGTIEISGLNSDDSQTNMGIHVDGEMAGTLENSGTITVSSIVDNNSSSSGNNAYGINISGDLSGTLTNSGAIAATAINAYDYDNEAYGIYVGGNLSGSLTNTSTGTITASASNYNRHGGSYATAYGIYISGEVSSTLTNDGTITVSALDSNSDAEAYGIYVGNNVTGAVSNNGTIQVTAAATKSDIYGATGIYLNGDVSATGSVTNTGDITVDILAANDNNDGAGIRVNGDMQGTMLNSGNITLTSTIDGYDDYNEYGVYINTLSGTMTNTGNITVSQTVGSSSSDGAYGVYISTLTGALTNSGTISSTGIGAGSTAYPVGLYVGTLDAAATITNSGTISATGVSNASSVNAVFIGTLDGTITNSGTISASAESGDAYAIMAGAGTGSVVNSGTISGGIALGGTVSMTNTGTLFIPAGVAGGIGGDYTQSGNGVLKIGATDNATYGQLTVGGTADISANNKLRVDVDANETFADGDVLASVISAGTLTTGASFNVTDNSLAWKFTPASDGNDLDLSLTDTGMTTFLAAVQSAGLGTGTGVARTLDSLMNDTPTGEMEELIYALGSLNSAGAVSAALSQLTPLMNGGMARATMAAMHDAGRTVQTRLQEKRGLSSGDPVLSDKKVWLRPFGSWSEQDDRKDVEGYDADTFGLALGADAAVCSNTRLGLALAYAQTDVDSNSDTAEQEADIDTYQAIAYGSYGIDDRTDLDFQADIAENNNDGERTINITGIPSRVAESDYDSFAYHLGAAVSHRLDVNEKATFVPSVGLDYTSIEADDYNEEGAGDLNLQVGSDTTDELVLGIDGKYNHALTDSMTLAANLGIGYDFLADESSIGSSFVGGGAPFTTKGLDPSPWIYRGGLGLEMYCANNMEVVARYDLEGREDYLNQTASVKFQLSF